MCMPTTRNVKAEKILIEAEIKRLFHASVLSTRRLCVIYCRKLYYVLYRLIN